MMMNHHTKFGHKRFRGSEYIVWTTFIDFSTFTVTLTLNAVILFFSLFFHKALWLMIMYHQTKFGSKRFNSSKDIEETVIF